jgi:DNA-binding MarR family transcriptional regulator
MTGEDPNLGTVANELRVSIGLLIRRLRHAQAAGELSLPETTALARLDRGGPMTSSALARLEQISAQSMGATVAGLEARGLVRRSADPRDGRQFVISPTKAGMRALWNRRNARTELIARALDGEFTREEIRRLAAAAPLIERLARTI